MDLKVFLAYVQNDSTRLLLAAVLAVCFGLIFKAGKVENDEFYRLAGMPGIMWLNALRMIGMPLIVANLVTAVSGWKALPSRSTSNMHLRLILYYSLTTLLACAWGLVVVHYVFVLLMPPSDELAHQLDTESASEVKREHHSIVDQIQHVPLSLVPSNILLAMREGNLLGVVFASVMLGAFSPSGGEIVSLNVAVADALLLIVKRIVALAPFGLFSLIFPMVATLSLAIIAKYIGLMLLSVFIGLHGHVMGILPAIFFVLTRRNPYRYLSHMIPSMATALRTSSSAATLPVSTKCAVERCQVDEDVATFVLPRGSSINMDGTAVFLPIAVIWMASTQRITLSVAEMVVVVVVTTISSLGAAPIPSPGLVLLVLIMEAANAPVNGLFGLIVTVQWIYDRPMTMTNVVGDLFACGIINHYKIRDELEPESFESDEEYIEAYTPPAFPGSPE